MKTIAIDIDDTLTSFQDTARSIFVDMALERGDKRYQRGAYCAWGEWRSPVDVSDDDIWPLVIERCHSDENILAQTPFPDAMETLRELAEDYHLRYVSNRRETAHDATFEWLSMHDFPVTDHCLTCTMRSKSELLGTVQYLVDDRPKTLVEFVYDFHWQQRHPSMARRAFGIYMPYNAALTDVPGIKLAPNWKLLRRYMIEQEILTPRSPVGSAN